MHEEDDGEKGSGDKEIVKKWNNSIIDKGLVT